LTDWLGEHNITFSEHKTIFCIHIF
jgi:hypothetical protein